MKRLFFVLFTLCCAIAAQAAQYQQHSLQGNTLNIQTDSGQLSLTFYQNDVVEAFYQGEGVKQLPSFSISQQSEPQQLRLTESAEALTLGSASLTVKINKAPLQLSYYYQGKLLLAEEQGYFQQQQRQQHQLYNQCDGF